MPTVRESCCAVCGTDLRTGETGRPRRFCSAACKKAAFLGYVPRRTHQRMRLEAVMWVEQRRWRPCEVCCRWSTHVSQHGYCSTDCHRWARQFRIDANLDARRTTPRGRAQCSVCGWSFLRSQRGAHRCGACSPLSPLYSVTNRVTIRVKSCTTCAALYVARGAGQGRYCVACARMARADNHRRKRLKRRSVPHGEPYTLAGIAQRDGWRCHLCGLAVRKDVNGMHQRGPTIDHLVPVSADGADSAENVALAHRSCNTKRNVGGEVQLRLLSA